MSSSWGPDYPVNLGSTVARLRAKANAGGGLSALTRDERQRYGEAVGKAIIAKQRAEGHQGLPPVNPKPRCASGTWHTTGEAIHEAIKAQHHRALLAYPAKVRRNRTNAEWEVLYRLAMLEKRNREPHKEAA
jgi:hypothetical protein